MPTPTRKTVIISLAVVAIMFGFSFLLAPLYNALCRSTGFGGKTNLTPYIVQSGLKPDLSQPITVQLTATNNANLPWDFYPQEKFVETYVNAKTKIVFYVKNKTSHKMTVQAIPSISPWQAAKYFHKIECFCFTQQTLNPGESKEMPVIFEVDNQLPKDIHVITLAYTLFRIKSYD